jgi:hypothetical protein
VTLRSAPGVRPLGYLRNRVNVTAEQYNDKEKAARLINLGMNIQPSNKSEFDY